MKFNFRKALKVTGIVAGVVAVAYLISRSGDDSSPESDFEEWVEEASKEELSDAYEEERQQWIKNGYCRGTGEHTPKMKRLNREISKRAAEEWEKAPRRNTDPNFRWTDANRWDKD